MLARQMWKQWAESLNARDANSLEALSTVLALKANGFDGKYNPTSGTELWKSNGTAAGTVLVKDIRPGSGSYGPNSSYPDGADKIIGGSGPHTLSGGAQKDHLDGGIGNDRLNGNGGHARLFGGPNDDRLFGYDGNDMLNGGSSIDRLEGGNGTNTIYGGGGNDRFFAAGDDSVDQLFGGTGDDSAVIDSSDGLASIEITPGSRRSTAGCYRPRTPGRVPRPRSSTPSASPPGSSFTSTGTSAFTWSGGSVGGAGRCALTVRSTRVPFAIPS